jgi:hypothetical protein
MTIGRVVPPRPERDHQNQGKKGKERQGTYMQVACPDIHPQPLCSNGEWKFNVEARWSCPCRYSENVFKMDVQTSLHIPCQLAA